MHEINRQAAVAVVVVVVGAAVVVDGLPSFWWGTSGEYYDDVIDPVSSDSGKSLIAKQEAQEMVVRVSPLSSLLPYFIYFYFHLSSINMSPPLKKKGRIMNQYSFTNSFQELS
ncbi:hypothetical protein E2C01_098144 [Portunus trituberculatus]|uniref:Uncharacterized protein n=1 Tax=Portunus trituberculatus TaxID=210409 RepID=A0A5B7KD99_PORTR|nr:hypothetical protein [Portunus trituberculatus]